MCQPAWKVYLSTDCQHRPYWDDTVADVHKDILSSVQTMSRSRLTKPQCINEMWQRKTFGIIIICLTLSKFGLIHQTRPLTTEPKRIGCFFVSTAGLVAMRLAGRLKLINASVLICAFPHLCGWSSGTLLSWEVRFLHNSKTH